MGALCIRYSLEANSFSYSKWEIFNARFSTTIRWRCNYLWNCKEWK